MGFVYPRQESKIMGISGDDETCSTWDPHPLNPAQKAIMQTGQGKKPMSSSQPQKRAIDPRQNAPVWKTWNFTGLGGSSCIHLRCPMTIGSSTHKQGIRPKGAFGADIGSGNPKGSKSMPSHRLVQHIKRSATVVMRRVVDFHEQSLGGT